MALSNTCRSALALTMLVALSGCGSVKPQDASADGKPRDKWPSDWNKPASSEWASCNSAKVRDAEDKLMYFRSRGEPVRSFNRKSEDVNATMDFAQQMLAKDCLDRAETHFQYVVDTFPEVEFAILREKARAALVDVRVRREDRQTTRDMNGGMLIRRAPIR